LLQAKSGAIKKIEINYDIDPNAKNQRGAALITFDLKKRQYHPYAEQFNYFQDPNEFRIGY